MTLENIGFFIRHFTERGTEVSIYNYANYNETILNNKSFIICFTPEAQKKIKFPMMRYSYEKFKSRFEIIEIESIDDMKDVIIKYNLSFFYTQTHGGKDIYKFNNKQIWGNCKTIKHCVFNVSYRESDFFISISKTILKNENIEVIPYMVDTYETNDNLRKELNVPNDAIVLGRYGADTQFNIDYVHDAIKDYLAANSNIYFLFMNTNNFFNHPNIIYLEKSVNNEYKSKFINTCNAMLHARKMGETFGLAIAEFSTKNKPILTSKSGDIEHLKILGEKAIIYNSKNELLQIFNNIENIINSRNDWNSYKDYSPDKVMEKFNTLIFNKK
tara:strand:+ start:1950 stop:2936 length:987 start_codon:yes stop_codon:yes gene_type:complete